MQVGWIKGMTTLKNAAPILLGFAFFFPVFLYGAQEEKEIDAQSYWYNVGLERLQIVSETDTYLIVEVQAKHGRVKSKVRKDAVARLDLKSEGFKQVVRELIDWLNTDASDFAQSKLQTLTGERFADPPAWNRWHEENADYLAWSESRGRFIVDEEAKKARTPTELYRKSHPFPQPL